MTDLVGGAICRVFWGHSGCDLPRGHDDGDSAVRVHRQFDPSEQAVTVEDVFLFGEDLTEAEKHRRNEVWG